MPGNRIALPVLLTCLLASTACTPVVKVETPSEPININLNVKIEHEIYIKVDKALDNVLNEDSGLF